MSMTYSKKEMALARADVYRFLSMAFAYPDKGSIESLHELALDMGSSIDLLSYDISEEYRAFSDIIRKADAETLQPEYTEMFLTRMHCSPNEISYGKNKFNGPNILGDISGFYKAFGFSLSDKAGVSHDNIAVELEFMSFLALKEALALEHGMTENADICASANRKFLDEHLGLWSGIFAKNMELRSSEEFYMKLGMLVSKFINEELRVHGIVIDVDGIQEIPKEPDEPMICPAAPGSHSSVDSLPLQ